MSTEGSQVIDGDTGEIVSVQDSVNQALKSITDAQIDRQIATAHAYPRSIAKFQKRALEMVTLDEETAESCLYSRPVGGGKFAEGMSIRMAEIVGGCYGNLRVGAMIVEMTPRYVKAKGYAHDLETNFASESEVIESTVDKYNKPYSERMRVVVAKACLAKARRDATFTVVPKALCRKLETEARRVAIGDATTLAKRRGQVMDWIRKLGIDQARVFAVLEVTGEADIGIDQLTLLTGIKTAIKEGDATVDESFPQLEGATPASRADAAKEALRKAAEQPAAAASKPEAKQEVTPAAAKEPDKKPSSNYVPYYSDDTAAFELRASTTLKQLELIKTKVWTDYAASTREIPNAVHAAYVEKKEALAEGGKL
ncbi:MAG TPA: hypothetical protein VGG49_13170 [Steroidobacteraceae bacterium]|jgi:hypothetical protein